MHSTFILVYTSKSQQESDETFLADILNTSRKNNFRDGITGFLVARQGHFLQLLEGSEEKVRNCFEVIKADKRHNQIILQGEAYTTHRIMPDWSMGLVEINQNSSLTIDMLQLFELGRDGKTFSSSKPLVTILEVFAKGVKLMNV